MLANGFGGAYLNFGGPILSEIWFPSEERTTATAIASVATYTGAALGFVVGPAAVGSPDTADDARHAIYRLYYAEAGVCLLGMLCCVFYFPDRPAHPPSEAAAVKRAAESRAADSGQDSKAPPGALSEQRKEEGGEEARAAPGGIAPYFSGSAKSRKYWIISLCMALPLGMFQGWSSTLFSCLQPLDVTEDEASWLGFLTTAVGCFCSVLVGAVLDRFAGRLKMVTTAMMAIATGSFLLFGMDAAGYLDVAHSSRIQIAYGSSILGGAALNITVPLFFELIMESIYGWADENIGSMITIAVNTVVQIAFLVGLAEVDPSASVIWTSWVLAASMAVALVFMVFLRVDYRRLAVDTGTDLKQTGCYFDRAVGYY
jgi:FLVCR family MFS transporter